MAAAMCPGQHSFKPSGRIPLPSAVHPVVTPPTAVAELQGLYGPFAFPERLLQKIWFRGDFERNRAVTTDGRTVTILHGGRWNLLGGPDFKGARLRFDANPEFSGDVELHLHAEDWDAHRHHSDPAYNGVVLHVVLFPPQSARVTSGFDGREIPVLVLLPLLQHDLEEYAADEAVEVLANRPAAHILERLGPMPPTDLAVLIDHHATARWRQKVHFARLRVRRLGWNEACHQTALEILGYRFNRSPMLRISTAFPLGEWAAAAFRDEVAFDAERTGWSLHGLRPANHPRHRLNQYAAWVRARPHWPTSLAELAPAISPDKTTALTREVRQAHGFSQLRREWLDRICGGALGGTRWDTLICDGFLPLMAARSYDAKLQALWYHWFPGDLPPLLMRALRQLQVFTGRSRPACHGAAQGLLGWLIDCERTAALVKQRVLKRV